MIDQPWIIALVVGLSALTLAGSLIAVIWLMRANRTWMELRADRQEESLRWMSERLTTSVERFHLAAGDLGRALAEEQGLAGAALQREMREQIRGLAAGMQQQLSDTRQSLGRDLSKTTEVFGALQHQLGAVTEASKRVEQLTEGVQEIGRILQVPKLRGLMGERSLELLLGEMLPERFWQTQHRFSDGRVVDAVIRLGERLVPIDAKFPLEAYRRLTEAEQETDRTVARRELIKTLRARVDEVAERYIRPTEGTTDFALMFVPAEGVYIEMVGGLDGMLDEALSRRVLPVSPASFFAYLSTVAMGLRGLELDQRADELISNLEAVNLELDALREDLDVLGRHLSHAVQRSDEARKRISSLATHVDRARQA